MTDTSLTWSGLDAPIGWHIIDFIHQYHEPQEYCGYAWERMIGQRITVMEDVSIKVDGRRWLHVSVAKPNRKIPTYEDLQEVRRLFVGEERECYQTFPPKERYVNANNVLHLWCCLDQPKGVLPQFDEMVTFNGEEVRSI